MIQLDQEGNPVAEPMPNDGLGIRNLSEPVEMPVEVEDGIATTSDATNGAPVVVGIDGQMVQDEQDMTPEGSSLVGVAVLDRSELPKDNAWIWWVAAAVLLIAIIVVLVAMVTKKNKKGGEKTNDDVE